MKRNLRDYWLLITGSLILAWNITLTSNTEAQPLSLETYKEAANQALLRTLQITPPAAKQLLEWLRADQFAKLDSVLAEIENHYGKDINYESAYVKAYNGFTVGKYQGGFIIDKGHDKDDLLAHLDKWVKNSPDNYKALCARGAYKISLGWRSRGTKVTFKTPEENLAKMRQQFLEAQQDLRSAVKLQPGLMPAYINLIEIAKNLEDLEEATQWLKQATQADPRTYYVREAYMRALQPKWLGSLEAMAEFGIQTADEVALNPRLWVLQGDVHVQRADLLKQQTVAPAQKNQKFETAIEILSQAFEYGDRLAWLEERISLYLTVKNYQKALADIDKYLTYQPDDMMKRMLKQQVVCQLSGIKPCVYNKM